MSQTVLSYTGRLVNNKPNGRGTCKWPNGSTYDGEWKDGEMHGRGAHSWPDGGTYDGEWHDGKRDGWGVYFAASGLWYEGLWRDDRRTRGALHDGRGGAGRAGDAVLDGDWVWDAAGEVYVMQGWGVERRGIHGITVYEGEWDGNAWNGSGTWRAHDGSGDIYCGQFDHGKRSGTGRMLFGGDSSCEGGGGGSYVGEWKDDTFNGRGVRLWANGDRYEGQWKDGKEHGEGMRRWCRDGSSFTGLWEMGVPKKGTRRWPNGDQFEGTFTQSPQGTMRDDGWSCCGVGALILSCGKHTPPLKGTLQGNTFHEGSSTTNTHNMGSSLPQIEHHQQIQALEKEKSEIEARLQGEMSAARAKWQQINARNNNQLHYMSQKIQNLEQQLQQKTLQLCEEGKGKLLEGPDTGKAETTVLTELNKAFTVTTQFQSQLKQSAVDFVLVEKSQVKMNLRLEEVTQHNDVLATHLRKLTALKDTLSKRVSDTHEVCKKALGETLTVQSSESEIQQCSRNISELTKKMLGIKPRHTGGTAESNPLSPLITFPDSENLLKPLSQPPQDDDAIFSSSLQLGPLLAPLAQLKDFSFSECTKLSNQHQVLSKELSEQVMLGNNLHTQIKALQGLCSELNQEHNSKWMLMRGLEGDEQFIVCPSVWSTLSKQLPQAQQSIVNIMVSKSSALASHFNQPNNPQQEHCQTTSSSTLPGCTSSLDHSNKLCMECDERPPNVLLHPCGHLVLCSNCAATRRKCPQCRTKIQRKTSTGNSG
ncbi:MORN motif precursor [Pelomyxa schiedti]|nr:MORN motif precursor [Pelomyxa schiedti]